MRVNATIQKKVVIKDGMGKTISESFEDLKPISCDYILRFSQNSTLTEYGLDIKTTHRTFTYEKVDPGTYLFDGVNRYFVKETIKNIRVLALILEVIK